MKVLLAIVFLLALCCAALYGCVRFLEDARRSRHEQWRRSRDPKVLDQRALWLALHRRQGR